MNDRHFREAEDHDDRNKPGDQITHQHARAGIANGDTTAHEQAGADGATQTDHRDLCAVETLMQAGFALSRGNVVHVKIYCVGSPAG